MTATVVATVSRAGTNEFASDCHQQSRGNLSQAIVILNLPALPLAGFRIQRTSESNHPGLDPGSTSLIQLDRFMKDQQKAIAT